MRKALRVKPLSPAVMACKELTVGKILGWTRMRLHTMSVPASNPMEMFPFARALSLSVFSKILLRVFVTKKIVKRPNTTDKIVS